MRQAGDCGLSSPAETPAFPCNCKIGSRSHQITHSLTSSSRISDRTAKSVSEIEQKKHAGL